MCHRYTVNTDDVLPILDELGVYSPSGVPPKLEMYPAKLGPVVYADRDIAPTLAMFEWGLLPAWWKPSDKVKTRRTFQRKCFNARSETAHEKPTFRGAFRGRRCLVPASAFFEKGQFFQVKHARPFFFAGLWERWQSESETVNSYTILTTEANMIVKGVGYHRMPVILGDRQQSDLWMNPDADREMLMPLFAPHSEVDMEHMPEAFYMNEYWGE